MNLAQALAKIHSTGLPVLRLGDVAACLDVSTSNAAAIMLRLARAGHVERIKRGVWVLAGNVDPLVLVPYLTAPFPCYISLHTALYYHGMISQVPEMTYCVSLARTRVYRSPLVDVSVHHIPPGMFFGYEETKDGAVRMAAPEKALVDFLYLGQGKSRLFAALPELSLPASFSRRRARTMTARIRYHRRRAYVQKRLEALFAAADQDE